LVDASALDLFKVAFYLVVCWRRPALYLRWKSVGFRVAGALGVYEAAHFRFLASVLPAGGRFVDVGAHFGVYTRFLLGRAGARGAVFAFEPHPGVFAGLQRQFAGRDNCHLFRVALSSRPRDDVYLHVPKLHGIVPEPALAHLSSSCEPGALRVDVRCLDDYAAELSSVDFIKADIEGGEIDFLEGSSQVIERHRPLVLFECNDMRRTYDVVRRFADPRDYALCQLEANGRLAPMAPVVGNGPETNFYLVPAEHGAPERGAGSRC
jgi:FkbM family methyltransferase